MSAHRYVLEVALSTTERVRFVWPESIWGAPKLELLQRVVDGHNLSRAREDNGRRPWWWARIVNQETEEFRASVPAGPGDSHVSFLH